MANTSVSLTPAEMLFRKCLLDCRDHMQDTPGMSDLVLRFTGGWVRDKLLGVQSHDIDVALSTMTGWQFGQALQSFMADHGTKYEQEAAQQGFKAELKNLHKIAANPEKSKHLETITTKMFGIDVDFVNLRKEVYDDKSRNPQMEFGTAEEDALRRDATVNALFYNIHSQQVEDFTQQGLEDMKKKIIRTPLEPHQTFKDDPLRVLRLIRFASRLGYEIDPAAQEAMKDKTIHEALRLKISRERIGVEIGKIVTGPDPYTGLNYINSFGLYSTVFADPNDPYCPECKLSELSYNTLSRILEERSGLCIGLRPKEDPSLSWILAAYVPWFVHASKAYNASREGIKATNSVSKTIDDSIKHRDMVLRAVQMVEESIATRGSIGMIIRTAGKAWRCHVLYSLLCDATRENFDVVADRYQAFISYIYDEGLTEAYSQKAVIDGKAIVEALDGIKTGPWLKKAVDIVAEWQFNNPSGSKEEAKAMIAHRRKELESG